MTIMSTNVQNKNNELLIEDQSLEWQTTEALKSIDININSTQVLLLKMNKKGELQNAYSPLQNFINSNKSMGDFSTKKLNFDSLKPVDMVITNEYDGSENIIINDDTNNPKLINTRFSVLENNTFNIPMHIGNKCNNIYEEDDLDVDTLLLKLYKTIPTLSFKGIFEGGEFPCGSYVFYFKFGDSENNLTNIVQESSIVLIYVGTPGTSKVRMGMQNENSGKLVKFELSKIDSGFDYVKIFYERASTDDSLALIKNYYMINQNFPIYLNKCEVLLTGGEEIIPISKSDLLTEFADISAAKTQTIAENILFLGNIKAYEQDYKLLQLISWKIYPEVVTELNKIGGLNSKNYSFKDSGAYYDVLNVYNNTGYWDGEYYRFGIVYIYNNNLLSPVFNILGVDLTKSELLDFDGNWVFNNGIKWESLPEDFIFNRAIMSNSKGVVKLPKSENVYNLNNGLFIPSVTKIKFNWSKIIYKQLGYREDILTSDSYHELFLKLNIKGFFFVRLKRIPTIIAQGMVVGLSGKDNGAIPLLLNSFGEWITKSFLNKDRLLLQEGSSVKLVGGKENSGANAVTKKALLIPDYDINEPTLNSIFTSQEFLLEYVTTIKNSIYNDLHYCNKMSSKKFGTFKENDVKLTAVPKNTKIKTDGENYFSSLAGDPNDPTKTSDVNNVWNRSFPLDLTTSTSLIRGIWGSYVGMSSDNFNYGDIVNIRPGLFKNEDTQNELEFEKRFKDHSFYSAISERVNVSDFRNTETRLFLICARGDCFKTLFTHRMMSNFIDSELPTNHLIINPGCWASNYAVRCTAEIKKATHSNLSDDSNGWYIPAPADIKGAIISLIFAILTANIGSIINAVNDLATIDNSLDNAETQDKFANELVESFEIYTGKSTSDPNDIDLEYLNKFLENKDDGSVEYHTESDDYNQMQLLVKDGHIKKVNPKEQESQGGFNLKAIFKSDDKWELHGRASINRADVNAVSFGSWVTIPICSSYNLALRDIDFNQTTEEALMNKKRAFYPYEEMDVTNHLLESGVINGAAKVSISHLLHREFLSSPFYRQEYFNRIYWSKPNISDSVINSYRMIYNTQFREYNKEYGAITKLISLPLSLLVVFQHGIGLAAINRTPLNDLEATAYLALKSVLPSQVQTLTRDYGSMWKDSVILTPNNMVYGVDTVAKKIWKTNGNSIEFISDLVLNRFLNEHITLSEFDYNEYLGHINVKTHYNNFKNDVIFTYYRDIPYTKHCWMKDHYGNYSVLLIGATLNANNNFTPPEIETWRKVDLSGNLVLEDTLDPKPLIDRWVEGERWSICYNEAMRKFITFYDWTPIESCNIDNIYFSFDKDQIDTVLTNNILNINQAIKLGNENDNVFTECSYLVINKVFLDKAFTNATKTYFFKNDIFEFNINITPNNNYLTFYYLDNEPIIKNGDNIIPINNVFTFGKDTEWKFAVVNISNINDNIKLELKNCKIAEVKVHAATPDNIKDPVLKYYNFRSSEGNCMYLWKHGQAGLYDNQGKIKPTHWYGKLHEWNFEFIVSENPGVLKIFNNLFIISNKTAPYKFEYEVVGEGYDWYIYKKVINWINTTYCVLSDEEELNLTDKQKNNLLENRLKDGYKHVLTQSYGELKQMHDDFPELFNYDDNNYIKKLPLFKTKLTDKEGLFYNKNNYWEGLENNEYSMNSSETCLINDDQLNEDKVHTEQLGQDIKKYGRLRGNMQYLEDNWRVEIRPINFRYAYIENNDLMLTKRKYETRHRDKFIRIKVRYDGKDLAVILAVLTLFEYSLA